MNKQKRMLLYRLCAVAVLIVVAGIMLVIGRGHTVYLDNRALEYDGVRYDCPYKITVFSGGKQAAKLYEKERGETISIGQTLRMDLQITEEKGGAETTASVSVKLPYGMDSLVLNLPGLIAGVPEEALIEEFIPSIPVEEEEETLPGDDTEDALGLGDL